MGALKKTLFLIYLYLAYCATATEQKNNAIHPNGHLSKQLLNRPIYLIYNYEQARKDEPPHIEQREEPIGKYMNKPKSTTTIPPDVTSVNELLPDAQLSDLQKSLPIYPSWFPIAATLPPFSISTSSRYNNQSPLYHTHELNPLTFLRSHITPHPIKQQPNSVNQQPHYFNQQPQLSNLHLYTVNTLQTHPLKQQPYLINLQAQSVNKPPSAINQHANPANLQSHPINKLLRTSDQQLTIVNQESNPINKQSQSVYQQSLPIKQQLQPINQQLLIANEQLNPLKDRSNPMSQPQPAWQNLINNNDRRTYIAQPVVLNSTPTNPTTTTKLVKQVVNNHPVQQQISAVPKIRNNRSSLKFQGNNLLNDSHQVFNLADVNRRPPPPVPTLSPWRDGFGK